MSTHATCHRSSAPLAACRGGLPGAIRASRCGAINHQIVQQKECGALLDYVASKREELNSVNIATAIHRLALQTKKDR